MEKPVTDLKSSILPKAQEGVPVTVEPEKSMTFIQYLHELQRKIKSLNSRFFKDEEMVDSSGIQATIEKIGKNLTQSKQMIHFLKVSQGHLGWK